jgi:hypothetical protein
VFVPISSTKSSCSVSTCSATITLQAALKNSSRSPAPPYSVFLGEAHPLHQPPYTVESLRVVPVICAPGSDVFG